MNRKNQDKWYKAKGTGFYLDMEAIVIMGREGIVAPARLTFFTPIRASVDYRNVNLFPIGLEYTLNNRYWNYPMLIEAFEAANPGTEFSREDVRLCLQYSGENSITIKGMLK